MTGPNRFDETSTDHHEFERRLVAADRDAARVSTADIDETTARQQVIDLVENGVVSPVAAQRLLVHGPSGAAFASIRQLPVYHAGWTAAQHAVEDG